MENTHKSNCLQAAKYIRNTSGEKIWEWKYFFLFAWLRDSGEADKPCG